MAGIGSRLRPHTLTVPKPLTPVVGKPIVQRMVEDISRVVEEDIEEIAFIIGDFGKEVEERLQKVAEDMGAKASIYHQEEALGTAHAILCAKESLDGEVIVAFADTLFIADFKMDTDKDGIIWVQKVDDPSAFGVVTLDENGVITDFVEKPEEFVSDLAIIGIYYFKDGANLRDELQYLIDNDIKDKGEYQITNALENMKKKGKAFVTGEVDEWLDCGKKVSTVATHQVYIQDAAKREELVSPKATIENSTLIEPVYIGEGAEVHNSVVGPYVSIGANSKVNETRISNSIVQTETTIAGANIADSMVGNKAQVKGKPADLSAGDFSDLEI